VLTEGAADRRSLRELLDELRVRNAQLEHALSSRIAIEQAKGMLAERYGIGVDEAFQLLRRAARSNRIRLHDLANEVVSSRETPDAIALASATALTPPRAR
jgi:AmiR/NasT family two-component response regulator